MCDEIAHARHEIETLEREKCELQKDVKRLESPTGHYETSILRSYMIV
jgi:hypothetical protein